MRSWSDILVDSGHRAAIVWAFGNPTARHFAFDGSIDGALNRLLALLEQVLKQFAVVHHRAAQLFRARRATTMPLGDLACRAVVLDDARVMDGEIRGALVEVGHRIPADFHDFFDEAIGARDSAARVVDEEGLDVAPFLSETRPLLRREWTNLESLDALFAPLELMLGAALAAQFVYGARILGSVARPQIFRVTTA
ncbi:MAG TPA: hypothetical protein VNC18_05775 [Gemmatimonadaceae bacterium]|nr:hypothetical protein [Gemmatimonadaceae bacterium]